MRKLFVIHPQDDSTAFLDIIWKGEALQYSDSYEVSHVGLSDDSHTAVFSILATLPTGSNVIYLGHGNSFSLKGAQSKDFNREVFFSRENVRLFNGFNLLCLSCKSADFLRQYRNLKYVAFGDLPTQMAEISGLREQVHDAYKGVGEQVISDFRQIIVQTMANSIYEWMIFDLDTPGLYHRIRIRLMKEINSILCMETKEADLNFALLELLVDMRNELEFT